jgi:two-component system NarL family response regulator
MMTTRTDTNEQTRVLIVDDHPLVREGVAARLEAIPDLLVVGQSDSCAAAIADAERLNPDIILLDVQLPDGSGLLLSKRLVARRSTTRVVLHTTSDLTLAQVADAGADAFVLKQLLGDTLIETLQKVAGEVTRQRAT